MANIINMENNYEGKFFFQKYKSFLEEIAGEYPEGNLYFHIADEIGGGNRRVAYWEVYLDNTSTNPFEFGELERYCV